LIEYGPDGKIMTESLDIVDFLDDNFPGPKLHSSSDAEKRGKDRELANMLSTELLFYSFIMTMDSKEALWPKLEKELKNAESLFAKQMNDNQFLSGASPAWLDFMVLPFVMKLPAYISYFRDSDDELDYMRKEMPFIFGFYDAMIKSAFGSKILNKDGFSKEYIESIRK